MAKDKLEDMIEGFYFDRFNNFIPSKFEDKILDETYRNSLDELDKSGYGIDDILELGDPENDEIETIVGYELDNAVINEYLYKVYRDQSSDNAWSAQVVVLINKPYYIVQDDNESWYLVKRYMEDEAGYEETDGDSEDVASKDTLSELLEFIKDNGKKYGIVKEESNIILESLRFMPDNFIEE